MIKINNQYKTIDQYKNEITQYKLIIIHINLRSLQVCSSFFKAEFAFTSIKVLNTK